MPSRCAATRPALRAGRLPSNSSRWSPPAGPLTPGRFRSAAPATSTGRTSASACSRSSLERAASRTDSGRERARRPLAQLLPDQPAGSGNACAPILCRCRPSVPASPTAACCSSATPRRSSIPLPEKGFTTPCSPAGWPARPPCSPGGAGCGPRLSAGAAARTRAASRDDDRCFRGCRAPRKSSTPGLALAGRDQAAMDALVEVGLGRGTLPPKLMWRLFRRAVTIYAGALGVRRLLQMAVPQVHPTGGRFRGRKKTTIRYMSATASIDLTDAAQR